MNRRHIRHGRDRIISNNSLINRLFKGIFTRYPPRGELFGTRLNRNLAQWIVDNQIQIPKKYKGYIKRVIEAMKQVLYNKPLLLEAGKVFTKYSEAVNWSLLKGILPIKRAETYLKILIRRILKCVEASKRLLSTTSRESRIRDSSDTLSEDIPSQLLDVRHIGSPESIGRFESLILTTDVGELLDPNEIEVPLPVPEDGGEQIDPKAKGPLQPGDAGLLGEAGVDLPRLDDITVVPPEIQSLLDDNAERLAVQAAPSQDGEAEQLMQAEQLVQAEQVMQTEQLVQAEQIIQADEQEQPSIDIIESPRRPRRVRRIRVRSVQIIRNNRLPMNLIIVEDDIGQPIFKVDPLHQDVEDIPHREDHVLDVGDFPHRENHELVLDFEVIPHREGHVLVQDVGDIPHREDHVLHVGDIPHRDEDNVLDVVRDSLQKEISGVVQVEDDMLKKDPVIDTVLEEPEMRFVEISIVEPGRGTLHEQEPVLRDQEDESLSEEYYNTILSDLNMPDDPRLANPFDARLMHIVPLLAQERVDRIKERLENHVEMTAELVEALTAESEDNQILFEDICPPHSPIDVANEVYRCLSKLHKERRLRLSFRRGHEIRSIVISSIRGQS